MDIVVVEGTYEDGKIELEEQPAGIVRARVRVMFLPEAETAATADSREAARQRAFKRMKDGINFGGEKFNREEIYEERMRELEERQDRNR
jgi:hypothetical protein